MKAIGVIPARFGAQRLPGKPLALIAGKPLVQHVYERAKNASELAKVVVATDDTRIMEKCSEFGAEAVMTSPDCNSGTDRVVEVVTDLDYDIVVNIQGDEPLISTKGIDECIRAMRENSEIQVSTLAERIYKSEQLFDSSVVKVVTDNNNNALYFSRSLIPYPREFENSDGDLEIEKVFEKIIYWKHIGIYAYKKDALMKFASMPQSSLEMLEKLEQLRWLQSGGRIFVIEVEGKSVSVDTPFDLESAERMINANE